MRRAAFKMLRWMVVSAVRYQCTKACDTVTIPIKHARQALHAMAPGHRAGKR